MDKITKNSFLEIFPVFRKSQPSFLNDLLSSAHYKTYEKDTIMLTEGEFCSNMGLILSGEKRIYKSDKKGREITLFDVGPGEACIINASCILSNSPCPVNVIALSHLEEIILLAKDFKRLFSKYEEMRHFVLNLLSENIASVNELVVEVAFKRMDERLMDYILEKSEDGRLSATHQEIASELGTAREVVSRLLKDFERKGVVSLSRHSIRLLNI